MPTYEKSKPFISDYDKLTPSQKRAFSEAVAKFVADLRRGVFRKGLRIKRYHSVEDAWEMTWADDGRALFRYGPSIRPGEPHVVWLRIGGHDILDNP